MLKDRIENIRQRIEYICRKKGINSRSVTLVIATKTIDIARIKEVISLGIKDIGESRIQEAQQKFSEISLSGVKKHLIGHLQSNKAKKAVELFDLIQSLDSIELAKEIDKQAQKINKVQDCLLEIKVSEEETKFGLSPDKVQLFLKEVGDLKNIRLRGLMTMAPYFKDPQMTGPYFRKAKEIFNNISSVRIYPSFDVLSMGMSDDFEVAVEEGSTMVRIGTAIFG
ncbi:MAG: YggS family pyridoxal phosphate-dependent enzyme [Elusimicrobia bacterium]|nr:YggS family pyridoxal phosphate-dependent enzyme [Elusimicrobiota bacterium]